MSPTNVPHELCVGAIWHSRWHPLWHSPYRSAHWGQQQCPSIGCATIRIFGNVAQNVAQNVTQNVPQKWAVWQRDDTKPLNSYKRNQVIDVNDLDNK